LSKIVIDTSIIINGKFTELIESGSITNSEIIIPEAVLDELQSQASQKKEQGFIGLEEIKKFKKLASDYNLEIHFEGKRPGVDDIRLSKHGRIDAIIKDTAMQNDAILYTCDKAQSLAAEAQGILTNLQYATLKSDKLEFLRFFDPQTMSIHLKEGLPAMAKRGKPGSFNLVLADTDKILTHDYLHHITTQILEEDSKASASNIEISKPGALVIQYQDYRIAITQPPFSEKYEITIVHPIIKMSLNDYNISEKLMDRLAKNAEGILISGAPGSGKSTLASGLANFYQSSGNIVKTFESPRDLQVDDSVTQYTRLDGSFTNSADILLLVRPDYTIFDEVRRHEDFKIFSDLRLTGVGMVGVVHANSPLDAIQRFIGKIELGIIPSVLDTVIFVKDGKIAKTYQLTLKVKVPSGMMEQDLARPVIEISDFEDDALEYEIYTFGEENVIVPVTPNSGDHSTKSGVEKLAEDKIRDAFRRYDSNVQIEFLSPSRVRVLVDKQSIPSIIGKGGSNINELESMLHIRIDVKEKNPSDQMTASSYNIPFNFSESKTALILTVDRKYTGMHIDIYADNDDYDNNNKTFLLSSKIGRKGQIKIPKRTDVARKLSDIIVNTPSLIKIYLNEL
jgi:ATPase